MDASGLVFGVLSTIDLCIKYGKILREKLHNYRHADKRCEEISLHIAVIWMRTEEQLTFMRSIWDTLSESHQLLQHKLLKMLQTKLSDALSAFDRVFDKNGELKRLKFALIVKDQLVHTLEDLTKWQSLFDSSSFLVLRMSTAILDRKLDAAESETDPKSSLSMMRGLRDSRPPSYKESLLETQPSDEAEHTNPLDKPSPSIPIFLPESDVLIVESSLAQSTARLGTIRISGEPVVIDMIYPGSRFEAPGVLRGARELAAVLRKVDPFCFGLLTCKGVVKIKKAGINGATADAASMARTADSKASNQVLRLEFVFAIPKGLSQPRSLRAILLSFDERTSINEILSLAKWLAKSVSFIHTACFVHKNIRPENILVFRDGIDTKMGRPYLIGFEKFRADVGHSMKLGDGLWERDLYRHPERQGLQPESYFVMQHDIYSLGVVLLEVGLKTSFITSTVGENLWATNSILELPTQSQNNHSPKRARLVKRKFCQLAKERLPSSMGQIYADVVLSCLTCLDNDNSDFEEDELEDETGIEVGVRYIEKVKLHFNHFNFLIL